MERKVFSEIHIRSTESMDFNESNSPFLRCEVDSCFYKYPLKIFVPDSTSSSSCQWIYPVIFGGGLVEGDEVNINVKIGSKCCALLASLSYPKVYCCKNGLESQQHMLLEIDSYGLLCVLPDPVVCYKNASYIQSQSYHLSTSSNLVALDWFTSGRYERGERWDFSKLKSVSTIYINNELAFKEAQCLQNTPHLSIKKSMKSYNVSGTCIIFGSYLSFLYEDILLQFGKTHGYGQKYRADNLFAVSPLLLKNEKKPAGCIVRFISESVVEATQKLCDILQPLFRIIGDNPFQNK